MKYSNVSTFLLGILVAFAVVIILQKLRFVLVPFVISILLSIIFKPIVVFLKARKFTVIISLVIVFFSLSLLISLLALFFYSSTGTFIETLPKYEAKFDAITVKSIHWLNTLTQRAGIRLEDIRISDVLKMPLVKATVSAGFGSFFSFVGNTFLITLFMLFMLAGSGKLSGKVEKAFSSDHSRRITKVLQNIDSQARQYLLTKTLISAGTGTLTAVTLWLIGVDFPIIWGFLTFLLNFIPNIGSIVAAILPFILSLLQFDTVATPILVLMFLGTIQVLMGSILEPKIMGFKLNLSPLVVLVSLIFWGWLWGFWGMILAIPMTATIKIIFENIEALHPVSVLMGGEVSSREEPVSGNN
ncbi:MAG: AI-2E family transporter [Candidatus Scalindua sp.]|nr:AI-2E family transporter [Candidatus Scalindua sp.]